MGSDARFGVRVALYLMMALLLGLLPGPAIGEEVSLITLKGSSGLIKFIVFSVGNVAGNRSGSASQGTTDPAGVDGQNGPAGLKGVVWKGAWVADDYNSDEAVEYHGRSYVALTFVSATDVPGMSPLWQLLTVKGTDGTPGTPDQQVPRKNPGATAANAAQGPA